MTNKYALKNDPYLAREQQRYAEPLPSREFITQFLEEYGQPIKFAQLCKGFNLRKAEAKDGLQRRLNAMARDGQLIKTRRDLYALVDQVSLVRGLVVGHKDGYGFLIPEDGGEDIFLSTGQMRSVFPDDRVLVRIADRSKKGLREGVIVEILEKNTTHIIGRYYEESGVSFVLPENKKIVQDIIIPEGEHGNAKYGELVSAEIINYPSVRRNAAAKVVEVLGAHMAPGMEIEVAIRAHNLPHKWSKEVLHEANELKKFKKILEDGSEAEFFAGRKDLRDLPLVTIDGEDARDFDDAVFCKKTTKGWQLYVAIADVRHYVKPKTALDQEAFLRGNSVYFPNRVVPMLPEILSNELCSLMPEVNRLCVVCQINIDDQGVIKNYQFYQAVMKSHARLTYTKVAAMLQEKTNINEPLFPEIKELHNLYKVLEKQREARGAIEFETTETKIVFGKNKKIEKILPVERNVAHRIIEECMLAANVCAAKFLLSKKIPALFRVHEEPDAEKLNNLRNFLGALGLKLAGGDKPLPKDFAALIRKIKGRPDEHLIQTVLLRSMRQAVYDSENIGHFGLAYESYGHFTSPIRRYPDLITHRAICHAIHGGQMTNFYYDNNEVHNFGEHCSMTERRADDATYDAINWLKCEFMLDKVGKTFSGVISGVKSFGIFVELKDIYVEGLLHITSLTNDYYEIDEVHQCLRGKRTNKKYRLGSPIKIRVLRADLDEREIDFGLVED